MKSEIFDEVPLNICGLTTSVLLATTIVAPLPTPFFASAWSWAYIAASCSYCCLMMACKSCWLILYGGSSIEGQDVKTSKVEEAMLLSLSLLYSDNNISVCDSRPSSCPAYIFY